MLLFVSDNCVLLAAVSDIAVLPEYILFRCQYLFISTAGIIWMFGRGKNAAAGVDDSWF